MIITTASEVSNSMQIYLLELKWVNNKALVNLTLNMSKASFVILISTKDDLHFFFFVLLINSCKNVTILK